MARIQPYVVFAAAVLGAFLLLHVALSTVRRAGSNTALPPPHHILSPQQPAGNAFPLRPGLQPVVAPPSNVDVQLLEHRKRADELHSEVLQRLDRVNDLVRERCDLSLIKIPEPQTITVQAEAPAAEEKQCPLTCPSCTCPLNTCTCPDPANPRRNVQISIDADPGMLLANQWDGRRTHVVEYPVTKSRIRVYRTDYPGSTSNFVGQEFWGIMQMGWWEIQTLHVYRRCIQKGDTVIDFGAWIGPTVLFAATLGAKAVYGIEPDTVAFDELRANVYRNPHLPIDITYGCISYTDKVTQITTEPNNMPGDSMSKIAENMANKGGTVWEVMCYEWTSFLRRKEIKRVDFIKWDCEGCEELTADSITVWLAGLTTKPAIYFSLHQFWWQGQDLSIVHEKLLKLFNMFKHLYRCNMISGDTAPQAEILLEKKPYTAESIDWTQSYLLTDLSWEELGRRAGLENPERMIL